jgi:hypothetical protein
MNSPLKARGSKTVRGELFTPNFTIKITRYLAFFKILKQKILVIPDLNFDGP